MRVFSEFNDVGNELNPKANELVSYDENNSTYTSPTNKNKKVLLVRRRLSSFVFACASVAVLPIGIYVPMFSEIFTPLVETETTIKLDLKCEINSIETNWDSVSCLIKLDGAEFAQSNYWACVVDLDNASDEFIKTVSASVRKAHEIQLTTQSTLCSFTKSMSTDEEKWLRAGSQYAIMVVCDETILYKELITTDKFNPVFDIAIDDEEDEATIRYIRYQPQMNPKFSDYNRVYMKIVNSDNADVCVGSYDKSLISTSWLRFGVNKSASVAKYKIKIYCSSDHPEKYSDFEYIMDGGTKYYLIYTKDITF